MKMYGHMRKKMLVLSFFLGVCLVSMLWLYNATFKVVGRVNNCPIYNYQLRDYQKLRRYEDVRSVANAMLREDASDFFITERKEGETFEQYIERRKEEADVLIFGN